ncbi:MAG: HAMP domain-containing protein [Planctomycetes bacterium]|nr:HAMP domain-containing protein [Planctomycetota bacterium]
MIRRISTKFLLAVLAAVVLPFLGFALFVDHEMAGRLSKDVVLYSLKGLAADLALRVDRDIEEFNTNTALLAADPGSYMALDEALREEAGELEGEKPEDRVMMRGTQADQFDNWVLSKRDYDLFLLVAADGRFVASNTLDRVGRPLAPEVRTALATQNYAHEVWFEAAKTGQRFAVDQHRSDLLPPHAPDDPASAENYHIGFASPVYWPRDADHPEMSERFMGVLYTLVNWSRMQDEVESPVLKSYFQGLVGPDEFPSAYGWIWKSDADTILAHRDTSLYGESVSRSARIRLPQMVEAARASDWGLYPEYEFFGRRKNAAFKHTKAREDGGFGWIVGVGIDNDDIFTGVRELRALLFKATLVVLLVAVVWTMVIARRTTAPILALREHALRVGAGDLDGRVAVSTRDELGELAGALNTMTQELKENRERLVRAEKDAAWREMARQVAHDIKNPLTPIQISIDVAKRARDERSPEFDAIFERTVDIVQRQVAHLREIASDFHALTGARKPVRERVDLAELLAQVLELNRAYAGELGVELELLSIPAVVLGDAALLRRVLMNLVSNALEAMPNGGRLRAEIASAGGELELSVRDWGSGLPEEVRSRLFEPYFTTRSKGTGLGLAIAKRVVEDHGGRIELVAAEPGPGTIARVCLPRAPSA